MITALAFTFALTATPTTGPAPTVGLDDAVRMMSVHRWQTTQQWNVALTANTNPPVRARARPSSSPTGSTTLAAIRNCESGGDYGAVSADGTYRGAYQFDYSTWRSVGGTGDPAAASPAEQDHRAQLLYNQAGSTPWPVCGTR